jgi:hypothetical protein
MSNEIFLTVRINDKCEPIDRGDMYEDPLNDALEEKKLGEVTGGGSQLNDQYQVEYCELEVCITGDLDEAKKVIIETLENNGLPKGSKIILNDEETLIGNHDVLALHFDNVNLPESVYEENNINNVLTEIEELLGDCGQRNSHTSSNEETVVYYGGVSFAIMKEKIEQYVASHPLCKNGKIEQAA